jgi:PLP dependent protein
MSKSAAIGLLPVAFLLLYLQLLYELRNQLISMAVNRENFESITKELNGRATLIAVSKTKPIEDIQALYELGQRDFGENYVQELVEKHALLPPDIRWHFIGHLQSNKVKYIAPFVHLVHGVDSDKLLQEINKQAVKAGRNIQVLLQAYIAREESKFGMNEEELQQAITLVPSLSHVKVCGLMGMASFSNDMTIVRNEFRSLKKLFNQYSQNNNDHCTMQWLSMGMSADYAIAIEEGSNMVRIGSLLFGSRN